MGAVIAVWFFVTVYEQCSEAFCMILLWELSIELRFWPSCKQYGFFYIKK